MDRRIQVLNDLISQEQTYLQTLSDRHEREKTTKSQTEERLRSLQMQEATLRGYLHNLEQSLLNQQQQLLTAYSAQSETDFRVEAVVGEYAAFLHLAQQLRISRDNAIQARGEEMAVLPGGSNLYDNSMTVLPSLPCTGLGISSLY